MTKIYFIISKILALLIVFQSAQFAVVSYFYTNHNEILVATCCKNKETDSSCKAKCFLEDTKKEQKKSNQLTLKKVEVFYEAKENFIPKRTSYQILDCLASEFYVDWYKNSFFKTDNPPPSLV